MAALLLALKYIFLFLCTENIPSFSVSQAVFKGKTKSVWMPREVHPAVKEKYATGLASVYPCVCRTKMSDWAVRSWGLQEEARRTEMGIAVVAALCLLFQELDGQNRAIEFVFMAKWQSREKFWGALAVFWGCASFVREAGLCWFCPQNDVVVWSWCEKIVHNFW